MKRFVTMLCMVLLFFWSAICSTAIADASENILEGRALLFNNGNSGYTGIAGAKAKFQAAYTANPTDGFTMGQVLDHSATPALDLDGWGVVAYSGGDDTVSWTGLDFSVKVIDWDGIASDGSSHGVTLTFPDGHTVLDLTHSYSESNTIAFYSFYSELAPQEGEYTFKVVDPAGNSAEIKDTLAVKTLQPPKALVPQMNADLADTTPTFQWTKVDGALRYRVRIFNMDGSTVFRGDTPDTDAWTVPPGVLQPNTEYKYRVEARDGHWPFDVDNCTRYPASSSDYIRFLTGGETTAPHIDLDSTGVHTWNHPDAGNALEFWIRVHDAGGVPENIKSVKARFPDYTAENGHEKILSLQHQESYSSGIYSGSSFDSIQGGYYTFVVEDHEGHVTQLKEKLDVDCLTPPRDWALDITALPDGDGTGFHLAWDPVEKTVLYRVDVYDRDNRNWIYSFATDQTEYDIAPGFLQKHELYRFRISAGGKFYGQNLDNAASMPWARDERPTRIAAPMKGGTNTPSIDLDSWGAVVYSYPGPIEVSARYRLGLSVRVKDPDGVPSNIQSVTAAHGDKTWTLNFDYGNNDTEAYYRFYVEIDNPATYKGTYTFEVTDADGNKSQVVDDLEVNLLPLPLNLKPLDKTQIYGTRPLIEWDRVEGASLYRTSIYNTSGNIINRSDYMEQNSYRVPKGVLRYNQVFSYAVHACRENFHQPGVDLDNISLSSLYALRTQPWIMIREPDLATGILILQVLTGMIPKGMDASLDVNGDGKVGLAEAIFVLNKEAGMDDETP